jgi:RNA polymerase sigma-70 factor (ECF subfamily)
MHMLEHTLQPGVDTGSARHRRGAPSAGPDALPDLLLIERARAGDERAIEALIRRYSHRLYRVARSVLMDEERAEAAVLEAFLAAFGDLSRYEPTGKFAAWLTRLAYNQARALRGGARTGNRPGPAPAPSATAPTAAAVAPPAGEDAHERRELEQAIARLPEVFRTVYVLRVIEGISGIETAASLGLHETTVRTRLFRAHRRLAPDMPVRLRVTPGVLELPPQSAERIASDALAQLHHSSMLTISASPP